MPERAAAELSADEFRALFDSVSNWGRWGERDERGALNLLEPANVVAAAELVRTGVTVSLSRPLDTRPGIGNPEPAVHRMTTLGNEDIGSGTLGFAKDLIAVDYHYEPHSHVDALCHVVLDGTLYNGRPSSSLTEEGATADAIEVLADGLVGRGVLLDVPRLRGVAWLEPGEDVLPADLDACEREQDVTVGAGDVLLVRTGHARRLAELGPWDTAQRQERAASHLRALPRRPGGRRTRIGRQQRHGAEQRGGDRLPDPRSGAQRDGRPPARLPAARGPRGRLRFQPSLGVSLRRRALRIRGGTGSPLNPIAIL